MPARLAIVDDDPLFMEYLASTLRSRGYSVATYGSGADLLQALAVSPLPEVALLDVLMPAMNGLETLRTLKSSYPAVQVVMLSGERVPATIVDAVRSGAVDYVLKPDDADGLGEAAIENAIIKALDRLALESEVARLAALAPADDGPDGDVPSWGVGAAMRNVVALVERVADSDVGVLLTGESGVGKEVVSREIHRRSSRRARPFVKVNCAALPGDLLESELFGHERGSFTGAQATRVGKFEFASNGTILLDEIGEVPAPLQAKLLHVLQDREFTKVGSNRPVPAEARVIAATNRDLQQMVANGLFREDLYYRLQVIEVRIPPLRERPDEIPILTDFFLRRYSARYGKPVKAPSAQLRDALQQHLWPGNIRELENTIKRLVILQDEQLAFEELRRPTRRPTLVPSLPRAAAIESVASAPPEPPSELVAVAAPAPAAVVAQSPSPSAEATGGADINLLDVARAAATSAERDAIASALERFRWNRRKAARSLGVSYKTLLNKMKSCGISAPADDEGEDD